MTEIRKYIYSRKEEMLDVLSELIAIPSVKGDPAENAPFGVYPKKALDKMLAICEKSGFSVKNCKNAVGLAQYGETPALGILCHLDVVPAEPENWKSNPYRMTERDGKIFGRGVIDDKGPLVAALYAMKCVKELGIPLKNGVQLIFGTDEENGSEDLEIYRKCEKLPPCVFTPDGSFPVINIEKGMMRSCFKGDYKGGSVINFRGGSIPNAVPDKAECVINGISCEDVKTAIAADKSGAEFTVTEENGRVRIDCRGASAHASTPESGINAVTALISLLTKLPLADGQQKVILNGLAEKFPFGETDGKSAGMKISDEASGALTLVFSIFSMNESECCGTIDVRFPVCSSLAETEERERSALSAAGCRFDSFMGEEPHCVPDDSEFVKTLLGVYEEVTGEKGGCIAIGGGTYVHTIEGGVAFGAERGDTNYNMHGADEFVSIDELLDDAVIFAEAIVRICGLSSDN